MQKRAARLAAVAVSAAMATSSAVAGCGWLDGSDPSPSTTGADSSSGAPTDTDASNGRVAIDADVYEFVASCFLPGDGNISVTGAGYHPDSGVPVDLLLRSVPAKPYFGMRVDGQLIESALNAELTFTIDEGHLEATDVEFVRDLDLLTGEGESVGQGSISIQCDDYTNGPAS